MSKPSREAWVTCPNCKGQFNVHKMLLSKFSNLKLYCPHCSREFSKEQSPFIWGND